MTEVEEVVVEHPHRRPYRCRRRSVLVLAGAAATGSTLLLFFFSATHHHHHHHHRHNHQPTTQIDLNFPPRSSSRRRLLSSSSFSSPVLSGYYADPKSVVPRPMTMTPYYSSSSSSSATTTGVVGDDDHASRNDGGGSNNDGRRRGGGRRRANCQIIYVLGVEGSIHHGFMPVIKSLAERQVDVRTGSPYRVVKGSEALRAAIFRPSSSSSSSGGLGGCTAPRDDGDEEEERLCDSPMSDPAFVQNVLDEICPDYYDDDDNDDDDPREGGGEESRKKKKEEEKKEKHKHHHHVIIEGNSFPSGREKERYRVNRRKYWPDMTPEEISHSTSAANHPTNLATFYDSFGPYADVRFVVLHRPYLETIASHPNFDGGPARHSVVVSGFALLLGRFLAGHMYAIYGDGGGGGGGGGAAVVPLWTLVCADRLTSRSFLSERELVESRDGVLALLADFLGWPVSHCPECFDHWAESAKMRSSSPRERLGDDATEVLLDHARHLEAYWPPRRMEDGSPLQRCGLL